LFVDLDAAMKRKEFAAARQILKAIRRGKKALSRLAEDCGKAPVLRKEEYLPPTEATVPDLEDDASEGENATAAIAEPLRQMFCNFYPSLTLLCIGQHPQWRSIERRKNRSSPLVREYVRNVLTDELDDKCFVLLRSLLDVQRKLRQSQPKQYRAKLRYCTGLREVLKYVTSRRVRMVVIAPDVEPVKGDVDLLQMDGAAREKMILRGSANRLGLDGTVQAIAMKCAEKGVPCFCALSRKGISSALRMTGSRMSAVAILSAEGAHEECRAVVRCAVQAMEEYAQQVESVPSSAGEGS
jgi:ribosomal protein L7Ae-like RNA K-turn-binding protein